MMIFKIKRHLWLTLVVVLTIVSCTSLPQPQIEEVEEAFLGCDCEFQLTHSSKNAFEGNDTVTMGEFIDFDDSELFYEQFSKLAIRYANVARLGEHTASGKLVFVLEPYKNEGVEPESQVIVYDKYLLHLISSHYPIIERDIKRITTEGFKTLLETEVILSPERVKVIQDHYEKNEFPEHSHLKGWKIHEVKQGEYTLEVKVIFGTGFAPIPLHFRYHMTKDRLEMQEAKIHPLLLEELG